MLVSGKSMFVEEQEEEEEEGQLTGTRKSTAGEKTKKLLANLPILGWVVSAVGASCMRRFADVSRRRRSFKLALFFQTQMLLGLAGFLAFFIVAMQDMAVLSDTSRVPSECNLPASKSLSDGSSVPLFTSAGELDLSGVFNYTIGARRSLSCSNENLAGLDAACELTELESLLVLMLVTAIFFLFVMVTCAVVFAGFKFFSNIPMESLDIDVTSCKVSFLGSACRYGPWVVRSLTLVNIALVLSLLLLPSVANYCRGTFEKTHNCVHMFDDCVRSQFSNCRYYYSDNCVGENLPHAVGQAGNFKSCKDPDFSKKFSGRTDVRLVYPTACSRCWALHSDCKNPQINRVRLTNNLTSEEFVFKNDSHTISPALHADDFDQVGKDIYCRCIQGVDSGNEKALYFNATKLETSCEDLPTASACPATLSTAVALPDPIPNATYWSIDWQDSSANTTREQQCSWAPSRTAFFYEAQECTQGGSTLNRLAFVLSYVTILLITILIVIGLSVRFSVQPETWSYSPQPPNEPWYWKLLRVLGPG